MALRPGRLLAAAAAGALVAGGAVLTAPVASACPSGFLADPFTGQCYVPSALPTVNGIPCIPGKSMGTCMGFLQNMSPPGGGAPPGGPWP